MKYQVKLPIAAALSLALAAGCERRDETSGTTRTTSATPTSEALRDAAASAAGIPGTTDTSGATLSTPPGTSDTAGATGTTATTGAKAEQPLEERDREFITKAVSGGMAQVAIGTSAAQKATAPEVKSFANRMVSDHAKANEELTALAAKKGVTIPTEMAKEPKSEQDKLSKLTGKKFDKEYTELMVKDHEHDVKDFQKAAKDAKDPDVKAWAAKMIPVLEDHLKSAKQLETKVKD